MIKFLEDLHSYVFQGRSECHVFEAVPSCSGGKVFKNCHHQVRKLPIGIAQLILCVQLGDYSIKIYNAEGEHQGPRWSSDVIKTLAIGLCSWYGMWCSCSHWSSFSQTCQCYVGRETRLFSATQARNHTRSKPHEYFLFIVIQPLWIFPDQAFRRTQSTSTIQTICSKFIFESWSHLHQVEFGVSAYPHNWSLHCWW